MKSLDRTVDQLLTFQNHHRLTAEEMATFLWWPKTSVCRFAMSSGKESYCCLTLRQTNFISAPFLTSLQEPKAIIFADLHNQRLRN